MPYPFKVSIDGKPYTIQWDTPEGPTPDQAYRAVHGNFDGPGTAGNFINSLRGGVSSAANILSRRTPRPAKTTTGVENLSPGIGGQTVGQVLGSQQDSVNLGLAAGINRARAPKKDYNIPSLNIQNKLTPGTWEHEAWEWEQRHPKAAPKDRNAAIQGIIKDHARADAVRRKFDQYIQETSQESFPGQTYLVKGIEQMPEHLPNLTGSIAEKLGGDPEISRTVTQYAQYFLPGVSQALMASQGVGLGDAAGQTDPETGEPLGVTGAIGKGAASLLQSANFLAPGITGTERLMRVGIAILALRGAKYGLSEGWIKLKGVPELIKAARGQGIKLSFPDAEALIQARDAAIKEVADKTNTIPRAVESELKTRSEGGAHAPTQAAEATTQSDPLAVQRAIAEAKARIVEHMGNLGVDTPEEVDSGRLNTVYQEVAKEYGVSPDQVSQAYGKLRTEQANGIDIAERYAREPAPPVQSQQVEGATAQDVRSGEAGQVSEGRSPRQGPSKQGQKAPNARQKAQVIRAYHGAGQSFSDFAPSASGTLGPGIYFTDNPTAAGFWASDRATGPKMGKTDAGEVVNEGGQIYPADITLRNPLMLHAGEGGVAPLEAINGGPVKGLEITPELSAKVKAAGHDGIVMDWGPEHGKEYVVFDKGQVKSAIGAKPAPPVKVDLEGKPLTMEEITEIENKAPAMAPEEAQAHLKMLDETNKIAESEGERIARLCFSNEGGFSIE
jgi:hypothetical protein